MAGSPPQGYPPQGQPQHGGHPPQQGGYAPQGQDPEAPYGRHPRTGAPYSDKQKLVAGLLQIFLGGFGVGRFYTGHTGIAIAQIAVTWVTCGMGGIWPLVDGIIMLTSDDFTDINGRPLRPN
ncbi:MAG: TM2 domain-containing protein [Planctomycetes bacterium]|nr:TM2 domain-containing protein [Planctomycetota bacterium]